MANEEHLKILKQGVAAWNQWRDENPAIIPDLGRGILSEIPIRRVVLAPTEQIEIFVRTHLGEIRRREVILSREDIESIAHSGVDLTGANLRGADLCEANLILANLTGADLSEAQLADAALMGANLSYADLNASNLIGADCRWVKFIGANLEVADFTGVNLSDADLSDADLNFSRVAISQLNETNFSNAHIGDTFFSRVDLSQVKGLELVIHDSPSSVGVDTLSQTLRGSGGRFTSEQVEFFANAGVPYTLLEYLPSMLETEPLQFYQCFISYSTLDEDFTQQLDQDLNQAGIKTWKWDRDAVRGRDLGENIDRAIRTHDKTILVCSVNSLTSPQVEWEVQQALDKEVQIKTANSERRKEALAKGERPPTVDADVLIPIRLDDTIFQWDSHLKSEVTRRMVADFTNAPPGSDKYSRELQALIKALNPQSWPPVALK